METVDKTADELAAEAWPDAERMERAEPVELTLEEAIAVMGGKDGGDGD